MAVAHKGAISFGLVHIPVSLYRTTKDNDISFNQLCKDSKQRVKYKKYCPNCDKEVKSDSIVKGYQYEKDKYVIMSNDELEAIKTARDKTIHILQFCELADVDDIYYEKNYYAIPEKGGEKAYELLREAMFSEHKVAIAKTVLGTKETLLALCPNETGLMIKTLFYHSEIVEEPKAFVHPNMLKAELNMAKQLIQAMVQPYQPATFHDEYQERLMQAIEQKIAGQQIVQSSSEEDTSIVNLMDALTQSIAMKKSPKTAKRKAARH